jgi:autotransporter-associated beta strand protein
MTTKRTSFDVSSDCRAAPKSRKPAAKHSPAFAAGAPLCLASRRAGLLGSTCLSGTGFLALAALATAGTLLLTPPAAAKTFEVTTAEQFYSAINDAQSGDIILYRGNIGLDRNLSLLRPGVTIASTDTGTPNAPINLTMTGTNTFSSGLTLNQARLLIERNANLGAAGSPLTLHEAYFRLAPGSAAQTIDHPITLTSIGMFEGSNNPLTLSGVISGTGQFGKAGDGEVILTGANTYSGGTWVVGGVLRFLDSADNFGAVASSLTLRGGSIGSAIDTPAGTVINRTIDLDSRGGIDVARHPIVWAGEIRGVGQFVKSGDGELELTGINTYSGGTLIERGTLRVASDNRLGAAGTSVTINNNGALRASASFASARNIDLTGAGGVLQVDNGMTLTLNGVVSGSNLTKVGEGTLELNANNTYTGANYINGGSVLGTTNSIRGNVVFDGNRDNPILRSVIFDQGFDGTFAGAISSLGSLVKLGTGTLTLSGNNSYSLGGHAARRIE